MAWNSSPPELLGEVQYERRSFEVDPLRCPCGATMRVVAVILEPPVIRKILDHLALPEARAHAPPSAG